MAVQPLLGQHRALQPSLSCDSPASPGQCSQHGAARQGGPWLCCPAAGPGGRRSLPRLIPVLGCPAARCHGPAAGKTSGQGSWHDAPAARGVGLS